MSTKGITSLGFSGYSALDLNLNKTPSFILITKNLYSFVNIKLPIFVTLPITVGGFGGMNIFNCIHNFSSSVKFCIFLIYSSFSFFSSLAFLI